MWSRLAIATITLFFVTMNVLLWRSEIIGRNTLQVPPKVVWKRILENDHKMIFDVRYNSTKIGYFQWTTTLQTESAPEALSDEALPVEGMALKQTGYTIDVESSFNIEAALKLRVDGELKLKSEEQWDSFRLQLKLRPESWEVRASAAAQEIRFVSDDERGHNERIFKMADLRQPDKMVRELAGPFLPELLAALGFNLSPQQFQGSSLGLGWEAWTDSLQLGNLQIAVYRLQGRFLGRVEVVILVERDGGEILRVELPNRIELLNNRLTQF
jgi:hypothetical protein